MMIQNNDERITEYKAADCERRLNMFLQFPRLRTVFIRIDQGDLQPDTGLDYGTRAR